MTNRLCFGRRLGALRRAARRQNQTEGCLPNCGSRFHKKRFSMFDLPRFFGGYILRTETTLDEQSFSDWGRDHSWLSSNPTERSVPVSKIAAARLGRPDRAGAGQ